MKLASIPAAPPSPGQGFAAPRSRRGAWRLAVALFGWLMLGLPAAALEHAPEPPTTAAAPRPVVTAKRFMVVAAHPLAAAAGREIIEAGGSAVDAAIAVQMVLGLVEPQSSGIGGGGFLLHWDARAEELVAYDGRETAPAAATPDRFLAADGTPLPFPVAVSSGRSIGVPGIVRMLELAHRRHGRLPWARLFEPAIRLAENGFTVSPRLRALLSADALLAAREPARSYFLKSDGSPRDFLVNGELAHTLRLIAARGADALHHDLAPAIVAAVGAAGGDMSLDDLAGYQPKQRPPPCLPYRRWRVCSAPPPSSGGMAVLQMLGILEHFELGPPRSAGHAHLLADAGRLAFADRNRYLADPDREPVPVAALLDRAYLADRAGLIRLESALGVAEPGALPRKEGLGDDAAPGVPATSHVSIVDADGNTVALTTSIENAFGARVMVAGFLLNNQLTDFSFLPEVDGRPVANRVEGGKRPRSSMAPTMVFEDGRLRIVTGAPGGSRIPGFVVRNLTAMLDGGLDPQAASALPHVLNRNGPTEIEDETLRPQLEALGHRVVVEPMASGTHTIMIGPDGLLGGADPRREGVAVGE